jgi:hypothetical protein
MKLTLGELRSVISEAIDCWGGSHPEETYDELLEDDPTLAKHSVLVPDDVKKSISKWSKAMGLSGRPKKKRG